jgi:phosphoglycerate dehydrogenase-like enzyme
MGELTLAVLVADHRPQVPPVPGVRTRYVTAQSVKAVLPEAEALLVWDFAAKGLAEAWPGAARLQWMHVASTGLDRVLTSDVRHRSVVVTNSRGVLDDAIAEYVLGLALAVAKDLPGTLRRQGQRRWEHRPTQRLAGSHALVVGPGAIGRAVGRLLAAVGVTVDAVGSTDRPPRVGEPFRTVTSADRLAEVVGGYDLVVLCAPLTERTRGLVDAEVLAAMRPTATLVNVGRGALVDEPALIRSLTDGRPAAAALDVTQVEPLPDGSQLWTHPNVIVSPHMAGDVVGWRDDLLALFVDNLIRFRDGAPLLNVVDLDRGYVADPTEQCGPPAAASARGRVR